MPNPTRGHPPFTGQFIFEVDGVRVGAFTEVSGLQVEVDTSEEIKEGGQNEFIHRLPGRLKWSNLVLKRGTTDNNLFDWFKASSGEGYEANGSLERTTAALSMVDGMGQVVRTWVFYDAFPVKWSGPKFAASSSELATEELEVAHHGFRVDG
ncbi:MAG: phage tail protein [Dehalococcoidia bacterium]